jgi:hypothetical protein
MDQKDFLPSACKERLGRVLRPFHSEILEQIRSPLGLRSGANRFRVLLWVLARTKQQNFGAFVIQQVGFKQRIRSAVNDESGIEPVP